MLDFWETGTFLDSLVISHPVVLEKKLKMSLPIRDQSSHLRFLIASERYNTSIFTTLRPSGTFMVRLVTLYMKWFWKSGKCEKLTSYGWMDRLISIRKALLTSDIRENRRTIKNGQYRYTGNFRQKTQNEDIRKKKKNIKDEQHEPCTKNRGWIQVVTKGKQFLLPLIHPRCYSCIDLHLGVDGGGRLGARLCDKKDDFNFLIVNFPFICSNIPVHLNMEYMSLSWPYDIPELVVSIMISLIEGCC